MPRLRGPALQLPPPEQRWALLNEKLYGDVTHGGQHATPLAEVLPWSWREAFGREAPLMLEVGFNRGKFITALAHRFPDHNVVGIEIRKRFGFRLTQLVGRAEAPKNLRVIWGDAKVLVPLIFETGSLSAMFITFPDPWWKKRHEKRRLVDTQFAAEIAEKLKPGGQIWVKSDVQMISDEIREALIARSEFDDPVLFEQDDLPLTHREQSCIRKGLPIHRFKLTRNQTPFAGYPSEETSQSIEESSSVESAEEASATESLSDDV